MSLTSLVKERIDTRTPDLKSKNRALNPNTGELMPHSVSRHCDFDIPIYRTDGSLFRQGGSFPSHVRAGDISKIEGIIRREYFRYKKKLESKIVEAKKAGGAERVRMRLNMFGVEDVGSFVRDGGICTVFPEDD